MLISSRDLRKKQSRLFNKKAFRQIAPTESLTKLDDYDYSVEYANSPSNE